MHTHQELFPLSETPVLQVDVLIAADNHAERNRPKNKFPCWECVRLWKKAAGLSKCYLWGVINVSELQNQQPLLGNKINPSFSLLQLYI